MENEIYIWDLFKLKKNQTVKGRIHGDIRNVFRLEKENKTINNITLRDIRKLFKQEEEENQ